jgi:phenylpropionate dioxygenase-like ring-hydroxylating dioxygenase large terminal subunit
MFVQNCWYVAAWDHELGKDTLLARTVTAIPVLLWRDEDGRAVAFENRCCHRGAPLSLGRREGNELRCGYHGLKFDRQGRCVEIPSQDSVPPNTGVRTFPVVERDHWIWVWMGDPAKADESLLADTHWMSDPALRGKPGYMHYEANYLLIADNLLDFSHLPFVHASTLGGSAGYAKVVPKVERTARGVRVTRWLLDDEPAPFIRKLKNWSGKVDRWNIYDFLVPGILIMDSGSAPAGTGAPEGRRVDPAELFTCQALTPESADSTHYFFKISQGFSVDDPSVTETLFDSIMVAFNEDREIITAQARMLATDPHFKMKPLAMDRGLSQFRQLIGQFLAEG